MQTLVEAAATESWSVQSHPVKFALMINEISKSLDSTKSDPADHLTKTNAEYRALVASMQNWDAYWSNWNVRLARMMTEQYKIGHDQPLMRLASIGWTHWLKLVEPHTQPPALDTVEYLYWTHPSVVSDDLFGRLVVWEWWTICNWIRQAVFMFKRKQAVGESKEVNSAIEAICRNTSYEVANECFKQMTIDAAKKELIKYTGRLSSQEIDSINMHSLPCLGFFRKTVPKMSVLYPLQSCMMNAYAIVADYSQKLLDRSTVSTIPLFPEFTVDEVLKLVPLPKFDISDSTIQSAMAKVFRLYDFAVQVISARRADTEPEFSWLDITRKLKSEYLPLESEITTAMNARHKAYRNGWHDRFNKALEAIIAYSPVFRINTTQLAPRVVQAAISAIEQKAATDQITGAFKDNNDSFTRIGLLQSIAAISALECVIDDMGFFCVLRETDGRADAAKQRNADSFERSAVVERLLDCKRTLLQRGKERMQKRFERIVIGSDVKEGGHVQKMPLLHWAKFIFESTAKICQRTVNHVNMILEMHNSAIVREKEKYDTINQVLEQSISVIASTRFFLFPPRDDVWTKLFVSCFIPSTFKTLNFPVLLSRVSDKSSGFVVYRLDPNNIMFDKLAIQQYPQFEYMTTDAKIGDDYVTDQQFAVMVNHIIQCKVPRSMKHASEEVFFSARLSDLLIFWLGQLNKNMLASCNLYSPPRI